MRTMTVGDLIELLSEQDPAAVIFESDYGDYHTHSPLPWSVEVFGPTIRVTCDAEFQVWANGAQVEEDVALLGDVRDPSNVEDAEYIVRACNAFPEMLAALKRAVAWHGLDGDGISDPVRVKLLAAIVKAEAK